MARTVTFANLRTAIQARYDLPTFSTSTWLTTSQVNTMIVSSVQALSAMLIEAYGDNYYTSSSTLTTTADLELSSLPERCHKLLALWWVRGTDDIVKISRGNMDDLRLANYASKSWSEYRPRYRLSGTSAVQWLPAPNAAYTVTCDFVQLPAELSAEDDEFEAGPGWEEWCVADVCRKIASREEKDIAAWMAERADAEARIRAQAPERDEGDALCVRDTFNAYGMSDYELRNRITVEGR